MRKGRFQCPLLTVGPLPLKNSSSPGSGTLTFTNVSLTLKTFFQSRLWGTYIHKCFLLCSCSPNNPLYCNCDLKMSLLSLPHQIKCVAM